MPEVYREPVLGVHDLIPPEGRVTVELFNERGTKVVQRERATNAIMNHWNETMKATVRNGIGANIGYLGYNFHGTDTTFLASNTDANSTFDTGGRSWWQRGIQGGNPVWNDVRAVGLSMRSIILTDSTQAVDPDEYFFPGYIGAFSFLSETYAPATNTKRAQLNATASYRTPTALHYVSDWGLSYGNGTHNSVGIGGALFSPTLVNTYVLPSPYPGSNLGDLTTVSAPGGGGSTASWARQSLPASATGARTNWGVVSAPATVNFSGHRVSDSEIWVLVSGTAANSLTKMDFTGCTVEPFTATSAAAGVSVTGPTMTTIGSGTSRTGVAVIGSDLWLAYGTTLKRCAKPTNTSLSVTNTYAPAGVGTLIDITTDGTNLYWLDTTKVWVIDPTTGAVSSSWTHGLTGTLMNIAWGTNPSRLYIGYIATGVTAAVWNYSAGTARNPILTDVFTVAGVGTGTLGTSPHAYEASGTPLSVSGLILPLDNANKHWLGFHQSNSAVVSPGLVGIYGPSHMSRTVLGSPVVKTSSNSMRVTYEFGF